MAKCKALSGWRVPWEKDGRTSGRKLASASLIFDSDAKRHHLVDGNTYRWPGTRYDLVGGTLGRTYIFMHSD